MVLQTICKTKNWISDSSALATRLQNRQSRGAGQGILSHDLCKANVYLNYWLNVPFHRVLENVGFPRILPPQ